MVQVSQGQREPCQRLLLLKKEIECLIQEVISKNKVLEVLVRNSMNLVPKGEIRLGVSDPRWAKKSRK